MKNLRIMRSVAAAVAFMALSVVASAQKYSGGVVDKTVAVIGNEVIMISDVEEEVQMQMSDFTSDKTSRCELLEQMMTAKLFLMQARVDSLVLDNSMVDITVKGQLRGGLSKTITKNDIPLKKLINYANEKK